MSGILLRHRSSIVEIDSEYPQRILDALDLLITKIFEGCIQLPTYVLVSFCRECNAARFREGLEPRRDIYTIPVDVISFGNYVANIDSNAISQMTGLGGFTAPLESKLLQVHRASHTIYNARKFREQPIACGLYDPTSKPGDGRDEQHSDVSFVQSVGCVFCYSH